MNRAIRPVYFVLPDPTKASLGQRLRFMRRSLGLTIEGLARQTGVCKNVLSSAEQDKGSPRQAPRLLGRVLPALKDRFKEAFPETDGDPYDFIYPPTSFGRWMRNLRARRGLKLLQLAEILGVRPFTIIRYESDVSRPDATVRKRLRRAFKLSDEIDRFFS